MGAEWEDSVSRQRSGGRENGEVVMDGWMNKKICSLYVYIQGKVDRSSLYMGANRKAVYIIFDTCFAYCTYMVQV